MITKNQLGDIMKEKIKKIVILLLFITIVPVSMASCDMPYVKDKVKEEIAKKIRTALFLWWVDKNDHSGTMAIGCLSRGNMNPYYFDIRTASNGIWGREVDTKLNCMNMEDTGAIRLQQGNYMVYVKGTGAERFEVFVSKFTVREDKFTGLSFDPDKYDLTH